MPIIEVYSEAYAKFTQDFATGTMNTEILLRAMSRYAGQVLALYQARQCNYQDCLDTVADLFRRMDSATKERESNRMTEIANQLGAETLFTDTKGSRSKAWFENTRKEFLSGVAVNCVVCAIVNPEIGMSASHKNTVTIEAFKQMASDMMSGRPINTSGYSTIVKKSDLEKVITTTIDEAFQEFKGLTPNFPLNDTQILVCGISKIHPLIKRDIERFIATKVREQTTFQDGRGNKNMALRTNIGKELGVMYKAGIQEPGFYNLGFR